MMFDSQHDAGSAQGATAFEPMERSSAAAKKSLRGRSGALLTSTALVAAGAAMMAGEAGAQVGVPTGFAPAPADVVSYVQLSNGSVLVQLANQQSLLVTSNNFFIDGTGVLYLSPTVTAGITGGPVASGAVMGAGAGGAVGLPAPSAPMGTTNVGSTSTGVIFDDTTAAASSGGLLGTITGGPGLFGLGTIGTIAAVGLGAGAVYLAANAIRSALGNDDDPGAGTGNSAAEITAIDDVITRGENSSVTYAITDQDGIDESDLKAAVEAAVGGAATIASVFSEGATVTTERSGSGLVEGTEDTYRSINVTIEGVAASGLNVGEFAGPAMTFNDAAGNEETIQFALNIEDGSGGGGGGDSLELDANDGATYDIAQGDTRLFKATDPDGDAITYEISNNPTGIGIDSNTGLVIVGSSVSIGSYSITVTASSTNTDGSVETDVETYTINVTAGSGGSGGNTGNSVNADFDSANAGFDTLIGLNITDGDTADNDDNEFEVVDDSHLASSYVMDGLAGDDTLYFSEAGGTYHLDPTWVNGFEDVSGFETLALMSDVDLELNGGVLDSTMTGDIEHIKGAGDNIVKLVNSDADLGLDVAVTDIDIIETNNHDLTIDLADLSGINTIIGDTQATLIFTGQFTYDFAEGLLMTEEVTRLGLDAGNYNYSLTLDGVNDEDVREIYAYGSNEIEGDVMIDARLNSKISLIDLAGDTFTTGGLDGDSNIFATYDDELEILGGENDDDVDLILESDIEDGEFKFDGGGDDEDTLNINLNGDEIDTRGFGRDIDHVEYVDIDAPEGDGEAHLQFNGHGDDMSDIEVIELSDVMDDSSVTLDGDRSVFQITSNNLGSGVWAATTGGASSADVLLVDGFVSDQDVTVHMTSQDDVVTLTIGESELAGTVASAALAAATGSAVTDSSTAVGSQAVDVHLNGGDDSLSIVLGSMQEDEVTIHFSRANQDDHDTVTFTMINDMNGGSTEGPDGLTLDFEDDVTTIINAGTVTAAAVDVNGSQHGAVLVYDAGAAGVGFIYDHDGDGQLSDGDTLVDLTGFANTGGTSMSSVTTSSFTLTSGADNGADVFTFSMDQGDLTL